MDNPSFESVEKKHEGLKRAVEWTANIIRSKDSVSKLLLLDVFLFAVFNPLSFSLVLKLFTETELSKLYPTQFWSHYTIYYWAAVGLVFVIAVAVAVRAKQVDKQTRDFSERSTIKGLLPFGIADEKVFARLQREMELSECYQAITDHNFRFGTLSGESGNGKTSFLQAGLLPALRREHRCVHVKLTDLDPVVSIRQALADQLTIPEGTPADADLPALLNAVAQTATTPLVLLLDQFEQFFVHYKRKKDREPFFQALSAWYAKHPSLPVKMLVCIRSDFYDRLTELQKMMRYSLGPQQNFRLEKFRPEQAAAIFRVIAETEKLDFNNSFIEELAEQELSSSEDGLVSPVDIQILAWMVAGQSSHEERAFNRRTFQKLGGVEGLLERFLNRALDARESPSRRQAAIKALLALTDLDRNARAGVLTLDDLQKKLDGALSDAELKEAVEWLARGDVRLISPVKRDNVDGYELAHERLIPSLRRIAGKALGDADRATQLLDRRVNEWQGNQRAARYLLSWREMRLIKQQAPFFAWEPHKSVKEALMAASRWRQRRRLALSTSPALLIIGALLLWSSAWGQLYLIKRDLTGFSNTVTDETILAEIAGAFAATGDYAQALKVAEKISDNSSKVTALMAIATSAAKLGEKQRANALLDQALKVAEKIGNDTDKVIALRIIVPAITQRGDLRAVRAIALENESDNEKAKALALILKTWAASKNPSLADESSKNDDQDSEK